MLFLYLDILHSTRYLATSVSNTIGGLCIEISQAYEFEQLMV